MHAKIKRGGWLTKAWRTYKHGGRNVWYDPHCRLWTLQEINQHGDQVGSVDYTAAVLKAACFLFKVHLLKRTPARDILWAQQQFNRLRK